jgi:ribosomal RNA-processing protein 12
MQSEILATVLVFLGSNNREIVKSALGFVKLAIHSLSVEVLEPQLKDLVTGLLKWSGDHKNHFKAKVRHIFERMLRRFSWESVIECANGDEEGTKVLLNIKKRKERAKKMKAKKVEESDEEEVGSFVCYLCRFS